MKLMILFLSSFCLPIFAEVQVGIETPSAQAINYEMTAAAQALANSKPGLRHVPERDILVPTVDVSKHAQELIAAPYTPVFDMHPKDAAEWKEIVEKYSQDAIAVFPALIEKFNVNVEQVTLAGVNAFTVTPAIIPEKNKNRLLVHIHGGGYVFGPGKAGLIEAIMMAGIGGFKVISIDYRMPPDHPYPAALDDAVAVWKEVVKTNNPKNMAVFGSSTGGALTLALILRAKDERLLLPAAIAPGTPWSDLNDIGDSYNTNEWTDNVIVTWNGWIKDAARLYAGGHNMKEPYLSPIYGDFNGFPPAILTTGTRDLFLSNTVRTHRKLRRAGIEADLNVYEGLSHGQFIDPDLPEGREAIVDIAKFFDKHLEAK